MSIEDKYDEVRELIIMGKERGYLLYNEVNDVLPEELCSSDELDSIFSLLGSAGIEVIDTEQNLQDEGKRDDKRDESNRAGGDFDFGALTLDKTNDPVRLTSEKWVLFRYSAERAKLSLPSAWSMDRR